MQDAKFPTALRATLVGMPPTRAPATDVDALRAELSAARATIASLQRQLKLKIEAISFTARFVAPDPVADFDEPTVRRRPAIVRRESVTKVIDVPCKEVQP